ncbi:MAG TPA: 4-hydroxy-3-methylbut-2-enyl diphosphate reductase [Chthoniobacterales bacterium]|jgi:4-hydroxy-3-methylbut-2-enyl diphosphate reductase
MKVILAQHYGVCFGVRDAIKQAEDLARRDELTILGELVHNPIAKERLGALGAVEGSLDAPSATTKKVMITAHGASNRAVAQWQERGHEVIDGTCPLVHQAHQTLFELAKAGFHPTVIGKRGHVEVRGLIGDLPEASVIESAEDIALLPAKPRFGVVSQTTQPIDHVNALVLALKEKRPDAAVEFRDTVCQPTKNRQTALRTLLDQVEAVVVVGGRNSNNTLQLLKACQAAGKRSFHIERTAELEASWFDGVDRVGLTAGTSTLKETVASVKEWLEQL